MSSRRRRYAQDTKVPVIQSRGEIESLLKAHGADTFMFGHEVGRAILAFRIKGLNVRLDLKVPKGESVTEKREERRVWRAMLLIVKAKLEAVLAGVADHEKEWMPYTVMPDGQTVGEWAKPQIARMYKDGKMPPLLPAAGGPRQLEGPNRGKSE